MTRLFLAAALFVSFTGCKSDNPESCTNDPHQPECPDGGGPPAKKCETSNDCTSTTNTPVCDVGANGGTCVQCTTDDTHACTGTTPVCTNDTCAACTKHADCTDSHACMPDGSCAAATDVAYVDGDNGTNNATCTKDAPCKNINQAAAAKNIVKVTGTVASRCSLGSGTITILADPNAKLVPSNAGDQGTLLEIKGSANVDVYDLQINGAKNSSGITLADSANLKLTRVESSGNEANGISVAGATHLTCQQCTLRNNVLRGVDAVQGIANQGVPNQDITITRSVIRENTNGGIRISDNGGFHIVNNFIFKNGAINKNNSGGITINVDGVTTNVLDFNTIADNNSSDPAKGVICSSSMPLIALHNVVWNNGPDDKADQVSPGGCSFKFSDIGPKPAPSDPSNQSVTPGFQDEPGGNLHLTEGSAIRGKGDAKATLTPLTTQDIDGDSRPSQPDIGADQFHATAAR